MLCCIVLYYTFFQVVLFAFKCPYNVMQSYTDIFIEVIIVHMWDICGSVN